MGHPLRRTRLSLYYLATYLMVTGVAFLAVPQESLSMLLAVRTYDEIFVRFVGSFMVALSILVIQMIRFRLDVLYATTLGIRLFFLAVITGLYSMTRDPLFLCILAVVGVGVLLTVAGLAADGKLSSLHGLQLFPKRSFGSED